MTSPEQHANTVREALRRSWADKDVMASFDELVALAERADTLEREREGYLRDFLTARERAEAAEARADTLERERDEARREVERLTLPNVARDQLPALYTQARAEADRLREAQRRSEALAAELVAVRAERDEARREVDLQMQEKLDAQSLLANIVEAIGLSRSDFDLSDTWRTVGPGIIARLSEIVDTAEHERAAREAAEREAREARVRAEAAEERAESAYRNAAKVIDETLPGIAALAKERTEALTQARAEADRLREALREIETYFAAEYREGEKPYQAAIVAALAGKAPSRVDDLQRRADEIHAADRAQDYNHMRDADGDGGGA